MNPDISLQEKVPEIESSGTPKSTTVVRKRLYKIFHFLNASINYFFQQFLRNPSTTLTLFDASGPHSWTLGTPLARPVLKREKYRFVWPWPHETRFGMHTIHPKSEPNHNRQQREPATPPKHGSMDSSFCPAHVFCRFGGPLGGPEATAKVSWGAS